jgi:hypothetical protein
VRECRVGAAAPRIEQRGVGVFVPPYRRHSARTQLRLVISRRMSFVQ